MHKTYNQIVLTLFPPEITAGPDSNLIEKSNLVLNTMKGKRFTKSVQFSWMSCRNSFMFFYILISLILYSSIKLNLDGAKRKYNWNYASL